MSACPYVSNRSTAQVSDSNRQRNDDVAPARPSYTNWIVSLFSSQLLASGRSNLGVGVRTKDVFNLQDARFMMLSSVLANFTFRSVGFSFWCSLFIRCDLISFCLYFFPWCFISTYTYHAFHKPTEWWWLMHFIKPVIVIIKQKFVNALAYLRNTHNNICYASHLVDSRPMLYFISCECFLKMSTSILSANYFITISFHYYVCL